MKFSECNARQKKAYINIAHAANWIIGGLENTMLDNEIGSREYEQAKAQLKDHKGLVETIYKEATTCIYDEDCFCFNTYYVTKYLRDINFCGKEWLVKRCEARVKKLGW